MRSEEDGICHQQEVTMRKRLFAAVIALSCLMAAPAAAGGYEGELEYYTLTAPDGSEILMYQDMSISSAVLTRIPSGTTVKVIRGNPAGWMLVEYNGLRGLVTDGGIVILCNGI